MIRVLSPICVLLCSSMMLAATPEFRGVWIASVANIDWPSKHGLSADEQKQEMIALLDRCKDCNLNAVILQVRPMCDALYESKLEPWSSFLTGTQGQSPGYDPLKFAIEEAHKRKLELHAWINPYRAWNPSAKCEPSKNHLILSRPDIAKKYGKHYWLVPTHEDTRKHTLAVCLDLVNRYDLDGIHMDDYFYPYPETDENKQIIPFPDDESWEAYRRAGGKLERDDWRRDAVNQFVKLLYRQVHEAKPWVKVGISPFGIWRPGYPEGISGFDQYGKLYADARLWLREGWVDYFTPQLYWEIDKPQQSYTKLQDWWASENPKQRHLWIGNGTHRHSIEELTRQIEASRATKGISGNVHFSMKHLMGAKGDALKKLYTEPAPIPPSPWLPPKP